MLSDGIISKLAVHPQYKFHFNGQAIKLGNGQQAGYTADFAYDEGNLSIVEDVKPKSKMVDSRDWPLRKAMFKACYPDVTLREVRR